MMIKQKKKIQAAGIYGAAIIVLAVALIFCLLMVDTINKKMNESAISSLRNTTQLMSDTLEGLIEKDYDSLSVIGAVYANSGKFETEQLLVFCKEMELDWLGFVDAQGNGVDCFNNKYKISEYPSAGEWNLQEEGYSDVFIGRRSGRQQITLWVPVYKNHEYLGTVLGNVILSHYYSANVFTFYDGQGRAYVFDASDGNWIIKSMGNDGTVTNQEDIYSLLTASGNDLESVNSFRKMVEAGKSGAAVLNFNGENSYLCFLPMPSSPGWYVATVIGKDILLSESSEVQRIIRWVLVILCVTLMSAAFVLIIWLLRSTKTKEAHYREALFANVSANLDSAFIIYEKNEKKNTFVSDNIKRLLGLDRDLISSDVGMLFDWCKIPQDDPQRIAFLEGTLEKPDVREVNVENELGQNTRVIKLELIPTDLGQELAVLTDITKDKDIQRSMLDAIARSETASKAKGEFLSAMSHDLRTPINGVVGMTAIAAAHLDDKNRVIDCLTKINESTTHLLNLINEVLDMSQFENGRIELAHEPFNIAELLQNVLNVNYPGIQQKNHTVEVRIQLMEHEKVIGDPVRVTRIATNLISNAIKYTNPGGSISLELREKESMIQGYGCYELVVRDNGIGMSSEFMERIFEPFEREESVRLSRIQGTGLGLSIVKNMVELMMGSISVESEKDKGTTFRVIVNLRLDEKDSDEVSRLAGLPVLVVDDDIDSCKTVTEILCNIGMDGEWTDNGIQAVEMVAERHKNKKDYLAVLLDWKMPDIDGVETARRIRTEVDSNVPIIILTAYEWGTIESEAREAGVDSFLSKPIYKSKLLQKMAEVKDGRMDAVGDSACPAGREVYAGKRVLLAEDNELNKEIAVEILRMMGITVDWVNNGAEAVERFAKTEPGTYDLILMDIQMPKMNGYEATRAIRSMEHPGGKYIPIVAMTADAFKKDEQRAKEAGMDGHLSKPISIDRLKQILKRFLADSSKKREGEGND